VAIKFLFCMELTPGRVVEFCNEATLLNSLQHENIVHCHGVAIMPPAISLVRLGPHVYTLARPYCCYHAFPRLALHCGN
jgi:hypothetical protein